MSGSRVLACCVYCRIPISWRRRRSYKFAVLWKCGAIRIMCKCIFQQNRNTSSSKACRIRNSGTLPSQQCEQILVFGFYCIFCDLSILVFTTALSFIYRRTLATIRWARKHEHGRIQRPTKSQSYCGNIFRPENYLYESESMSYCMRQLKGWAEPFQIRRQTQSRSFTRLYKRRSIISGHIKMRRQTPLKVSNSLRQKYPIDDSPLSKSER